MIKNDYFHIAMNDFEYLKAVMHLPYYNQHCIACQQIGEKLLKHIIVIAYAGEDKEKMLKTHSLRTLYRAIRNSVEITLKEEELASLTDYYFDAKYPGTDFFTASEEDFHKCFHTVENIVNEVERLIQ